MDINIIISGNLTGFSRFYASPNANDIYDNAKFDFDYRNHLKFINAGEKAYAISFAPEVIAVSLVTRILDSFRRPGLLVVTSLIPRYHRVSESLNEQDKSAIYRLLNEINDKFYEKNFMNGMVNQNPAVLMQDYYSDILRNYALVSDRQQKGVNITIDVQSSNKRIGYVSSSENDMPKYLSSLMRKSYNGYHHVFFAEKAPQNIEEPAEEVITYKVRVSNDNRPIPGEVRLSDMIPHVKPQQGERDIPNQRFTYAQVLNEESGNEIRGTIENDTIVLTYRFPQEEKTVNFKFFDGANEVPLHILRPILLESNGTSFPIPSDSYTFYGKEIYGCKTIKSGNSDYYIDRLTPVLDLQRIGNGATFNVRVGKGWIWNFSAIDDRTGRPIKIKPVDIVLENRVTGESRKFSHVVGAVSEPMPGSERDWLMHITSEYYETIISAPNEGGYSFKRKQQPQPMPDDPNQPQTKTVVNPSSNQDLKLTSGQTNEAKDANQIKEEQMKRYKQYGVYALISIVCFGMAWGISSLFTSKSDKSDKSADDNPVVSEKTLATKNVTLNIKDYEEDPVSDNILKELTVELESNNRISAVQEKKEYSITYDSDASQPQTIEVHVSFNRVNLLDKDFNNTFDPSLANQIDVRLSVRASEIKLYTDINNAENIDEKAYSDYVDRVNKVKDRNPEYYKLLTKLLDSKKPVVSSRTDQSGTAPTIDEFPLWWNLKQAEVALKDEKNKNNKDSRRINALKAIIECLTALQNEGRPSMPKDLPQHYKDVIIVLKQLEDDITSIRDKGTRDQLLKKFREAVKDKENSESVNKEQNITAVPGHYIRTEIKNALNKQANQ